jgi:hypothetical protein
MAVDERMWGTYAVTSTVHKDRKAEANSIIPLLNVVMEAKFGSQIWECFTDTAKDASQGYVYDTETGRLKHTDEDEEDDESSISFLGISPCVSCDGVRFWWGFDFDCGRIQVGHGTCAHGNGRCICCRDQGVGL